MSSDDELFAQDARRRSLASPVPPSAGGCGVPESPRFDNGGGDADRRASVNENGGATANEVANSDDRVREVLYSDVCDPVSLFLTDLDWIERAFEPTKAGCCYMQSSAPC